VGAAVQFRSRAFNTKEPRDYFINPGCFGDDVCRWMGRELRARGLVADEEPGQEDWGWYLGFQVDGAEHLFLVGLVGFQPDGPDENGVWRGWLERTGVLRTLLGRRERDVLPSAIEVIRSVLSSSSDGGDVEWVG
jgi:hypothetical protein